MTALTPVDPAQSVTPVVPNNFVTRNPERAAWLVLLVSFSIFCLLIVSLPYGAYWWVMNTSRNQVIQLNSSGSVLVLRPGRFVPEAGLSPVPVNSVVTSQANQQATLLFIAPDSTEVLASVQMYGDTELVINRADSPRFEWSAQSHWISLELRYGRIRVVTNADAKRAIQAQIFSLGDTYTLIDERGVNVSIETAPEQTTVTAREGSVTVASSRTSLRITKDERAELKPASPPSGPFPAERNLIRNGDFQDSFNNWAFDIREPAVASESPGSINQTLSEGRRVVGLLRSGNNWGQIGIRQDINQDVRDFKSLRLQFDARISFQDLYNCGVQGTECPLMVSIRYMDTSGIEREWVQGFFYNYSDQPNFGLTVCVTCPPPRPASHQQIPAGQWTTFTSDNLLEVFQQSGQPAAVIRAITLYAAGHTFDSQFTQIQLLAGE